MPATLVAVGRCLAICKMFPKEYEWNRAIAPRYAVNLIQPVTLGLEEPPPLVDGCFYDRILVVGERDVWSVLLEQILIDMEAGAKRLQRSFQPFDGILLFRVVETLVVHAGDAQHHPHVPAFGQKHTLIPESVQVDVIVKRSGLFPRLDDFVEAQH
jgi:hypothetical protein